MEPNEANIVAMEMKLAKLLEHISSNKSTTRSSKVPSDTYALVIQVCPAERGVGKSLQKSWGVYIPAVKHGAAGQKFQ